MTPARRRLLPFVAVGALGFAVQLAALQLLVSYAGVHYLVATALAVETAILHNFVWHSRWTWRDRPPLAGVDARLRRLVRFNGVSALSSVVGTSRRFNDRAAIEPTIMLTIHPTTTSLSNRLNIVRTSSSSNARARFCAIPSPSASLRSAARRAATNRSGRPSMRLRRRAGRDESHWSRTAGRDGRPAGLE